MLEDQEYILNEIIKIAEDKKVDVIIIAGDVYDRSIPPVEAVTLLNKVLCKIVLELKIPVIAISGNHDSGDRLCFGSEILRNKGLYIIGKLSKNIEPIVLHDNFGPVNFYAVPYEDTSVIKHLYEDDSIKTYEEGALKVVRGIEENINKAERNIILFHGYVGSASEVVTSDSERQLSIGGTDLISGSIFSSFNYTALGHLHGPQKAYGSFVRYSGSPLKYSFSEVNQKKSVTIIDINEDSKAEVELIALKPLRDMRIIKGSLENLLDEKVIDLENRYDYICAVLQDKMALLDPMNDLKKVYPNILELSYETEENDNEEKLSREGIKKKNMYELFKDFYKYTKGEELEEGDEIVEKIISNINHEEGQVN